MPMTDWIWVIIVPMVFIAGLLFGSSLNSKQTTSEPKLSEAALIELKKYEMDCYIRVMLESISTKKEEKKDA